MRNIYFTEFYAMRTLKAIDNARRTEIAATLGLIGIARLLIWLI